MDIYPIILENQPANHIASFLKYLARPLQIDDAPIKSFEFTSEDPFVQFEELFVTNLVPPNQNQPLNRNEPPLQLEVVHPDNDDPMENVSILEYKVNRHNENRQAFTFDDVPLDKKHDSPLVMVVWDAKCCIRSIFRDRGRLTG